MTRPRKNECAVNYPLLADRGYDANELINQALSQDMEVVIPPKKNRLVQREYEKDLYRYRHLAESAFLHLKRWRGIAARYAKTNCLISCNHPDSVN